MNEWIKFSFHFTQHIWRRLEELEFPFLSILLLCLPSHVLTTLLFSCHAMPLAMLESVEFLVKCIYIVKAFHIIFNSLHSFRLKRETADQAQQRIEKNAFSILERCFFPWIIIMPMSCMSESYSCSVYFRQNETLFGED